MNTHKPVRISLASPAGTSHGFTIFASLGHTNPASHILTTQASHSPTNPARHNRTNLASHIQTNVVDHSHTKIGCPVISFQTCMVLLISVDPVKMDRPDHI